MTHPHAEGLAERFHELYMKEITKVIHLPPIAWEDANDEHRDAVTAAMSAMIEEEIIITGGK